MNEKESNCCCIGENGQGEKENSERSGKKKAWDGFKRSPEEKVESYEDFLRVFHMRIRYSESGCMEWTGSLCSGGYGTIRLNGKTQPTHRAAYLLKTGATLSRKDQVCHHCDNPICLNIDHLFLGSQGDNMKDMLKKGRKSYDWMKGRGQAIPCKVSEDQVREIRKRLSGGEHYVLLAKEFGISKLSVANIRDRRTWKTL